MMTAAIRIYFKTAELVNGFNNVTLSCASLLSTTACLFFPYDAYRQYTVVKLPDNFPVENRRITEQNEGERIDIPMRCWFGSSSVCKIKSGGSEV
ncbi:hypothetical protein Tco_0267984 [Tanacetum coccineum]